MTFRADVDGSGECHIPEMFADPYRRLSAALDWARVYGGRGAAIDCHYAAVELDAAAAAADEIAAQARTLAARARDLSA